jgi:hypothetical protein
MIINVKKICNISELQLCTKEKLVKEGFGTSMPWVVFGYMDNEDFIIGLKDYDMSKIIEIIT